MEKDYNPDIVSVVDEEGKEHIFEELDRIETDDGRYVALLPIFDDGDVIILKVFEENSETYLAPIEDESEFDEVAQYFEERLSDLFFDDESIDEEEDK